MFLGCYLVNSALDVRTGDVNKLVALVGAINAYEIALLCIGILLLRRRQWSRDGVLLLLIQMLFLADGPFILPETAMASAIWASAFNIGLLILAVIKCTVAMRALRMPLRPRTLGFLILQLVLIYAALPLFFAHVASDGMIGAAPMYLAWWIVGCLPMLYELLTKLDPLPADAGTGLVVRRSYVIVPWLILIAHLGFFQYAYRSPFSGADLVPIFLGLAMATLRVRPTSFMTLSDLRVLRVILPAVAFILAYINSDMDLHLGYGSASIVSPLVISTAAVFLVYAYFLSTSIFFYTLAVMSAMEFFHLIGPSPTTLWNSAAAATDNSYRLATAIFPSTPTGWGILAILTAFILLALGGFITLRTKPPSI